MMNLTYVPYHKLTEAQKNQVNTRYDIAGGSYNKYGYNLNANGSVFCRKRLVELQGTFDHPDNKHARWGKIVYVADDIRVMVSHVGWGMISELRGLKSL